MKTDVFFRDDDKFNAVYLNDGGACYMDLKDRIYKVNAKVIIEV